METRVFRPENVLGLTLPVAIFFAWPDGTSYHALVFSLAWAWLLLLPWPSKEIPTWQGGVVSPAMYRMASLLAGPFFLLLCFLAPVIGNFLLWLKIAYFIGFSGRFAYLTRLNGFIKTMCLCLWALAALLPIVWSPLQVDSYNLLYLLLLGLLWALACAFLLLLIRQPAAHSLALLLLHLGPLPPLALAWPDIACWVLAPLVLMLALLRYNRGHSETPPVSGEERGVLWLPLWLFRTAMLTWWCLGCALCVTLAWWLPGHDYFFEYNAWIKAVCLGLFVLICLGLLLEYSLPLMGRPEPEGHWRRDQSWGPMLSALAMLLLLLPALLLPEPKEPDFYFENRARAVLLNDAVVLGRQNQDIDIALPEDALNIKHVYIISRLVNGGNLPQGQVVAVIAVMRESGLPGVYYLRAGIDTADQDLGQSRIMALAKHQPVEYASQTQAFSPDGQAYFQRGYVSGFFLQETSEFFSSISLHYVPLDNFAAQDGSMPYLLVEKIMVD